VTLTPYEHSLVDFEPGSTRATAADIAVLTDTLREMTGVEVEKYIVPGYNIGGHWIETPGL